VELPCNYTRVVAGSSLACAIGFKNTKVVPSDPGSGDAGVYRRAGDHLTGMAVAIVRRNIEFAINILDNDRRERSKISS